MRVRPSRHCQSGDECENKTGHICEFSFARMVQQSLNGFDRNRQQVVDQADFFLQKGLAVSHAAEHAIEASHGIDTGANLVVGREQIFSSLPDR